MGIQVLEPRIHISGRNTALVHGRFGMREFDASAIWKINALERPDRIGDLIRDLK